jgi:hypothetical protein
MNILRLYYCLLKTRVTVEWARLLRATSFQRVFCSFYVFEPLYTISVCLPDSRLLGQIGKVAEK